MNYSAELSFTEDLLQNFRLELHFIGGKYGYDTFSTSNRLLMNLLNVSPNPDYLTKELHIHCQPNTIYHLDNSLYCNYLLFRLPGNEEDPIYAHVGPYTPSLITQKNIFEIADKYTVPAEKMQELKQFYQNLPWISDENTLLSIFCTLGKRLWGDMNSFSVKKITTLISNDPNLFSFPSDLVNNDNRALNMQLLEQRYELEKQLIQTVSAGQTHKAELIISTLAHNQYETRTTNTLRNLKNYLIVLNTVLRIAAVDGSVHPFYVDQISSKYAHKIEQLSSEASFESLIKEMVHKYCLLVKNHSTKGYSLLIQKVLSSIDYDLTADLSLKALAESLNVNASYLSSLFKREVGMTLTEYVNHKRIQQALLLLNSTDMQIQMIAQYCGIPGVNYFTKTFRKIVGKTPSEYRKSILNLV